MQQWRYIKWMSRAFAHMISLYDSLIIVKYSVWSSNKLTVISVVVLSGYNNYNDLEPKILHLKDFIKIMKNNSLLVLSLSSFK